MAKNKNGNGKRPESRTKEDPRLHPDTVKSIWAVVFLGSGIVLGLAYFNMAGPAGELIYSAFGTVLGDWGYVVLPLSLFLMAGVFFLSHRRKIVGITSLGGMLLVLSTLGLLNLLAPPIHSGWLGWILKSLQIPFGWLAALILNLIIFAVAALPPQVRAICGPEPPKFR